MDQLPKGGSAIAKKIPIFGREKDAKDLRVYAGLLDSESQTITWSEGAQNDLDIDSEILQ